MVDATKENILQMVPAMCPLCLRDNGEPIAVGEDFEYRTSLDSFVMNRCSDCRLIYLNPRPAIEEHSRIYPNDYHAFNFSSEKFGLIHRIRQRIESQRLLKWCKGLPEDARILDVGCGDGFHLKLLRDFGRSKFELQGVEMDNRAATRARSAGIKVFEGTIEEFPKGELYDLALMIMTVEHLVSPVVTLRAVYDQLKPGGRIVIITDNTNALDFSLFRGGHWGGYHFPRHLHLFDEQTLCKTMSAAGFETTHVKTSFSPVNWVYSIRNWIDDWNGPEWIVNRFSLGSPIALSIFTVIDIPLSVVGRGAILQGIFRKPLINRNLS